MEEGGGVNPYFPDSLPPSGLNYANLITLVGQANAALARYDGLLQGIINPEVLLSPLTTQEAVLSSKIEGTQATLDEVLEHEAGQKMSPEKTDDILEIVNYRVALHMASEALSSRSLSLSLIKEMHALLMNGVRGEDKMPGKFRNDQVFIGRPGSSIEQATFIPPSPLQLVDHLEALERYMVFEEKDILLQTAVIHAQFEIIHPFNDGNGRIGRLLIPLFLYQKRVLARPMFYLSGYLESHREEYYERLGAISREKDWEGWIAFFLKSIIEQSKINSDKVKGIIALYERLKSDIVGITHSQFAINALDAVFNKPIFKTTDFFFRSGIPTKATSSLILRQMQTAGILVPLKIASGRRPATLCFPELINLTEGRKVV